VRDETREREERIDDQVASTPSNQLARLRLTDVVSPMGFPMGQSPFPVPAGSPRSHKGYTATPASMSSPRTQKTFEQAMAATPRGLDMMALHAMSSPRFYDPNAPVNLVPFMDPVSRNPSVICCCGVCVVCCVCVCVCVCVEREREERERERESV